MADDHTPAEDQTPTTEQPATDAEQPTEVVDAVDDAGEPAAERDAAVGARTATSTTKVTRERWLDGRSIIVAAVSVVLLGGAFALGYAVGDHDGNDRSGGRDGRGGRGMQAFGGGNGGPGGQHGRQGDRGERGEGGWGARGEGFGGRGGLPQRGGDDTRGDLPGRPDAGSAAPAPGDAAPAAPAAPGDAAGTTGASTT